MNEIPLWLGALGAVVVVASALGTAVAVYRTKLTDTSLGHARETIVDLETEIHGFERRETRLISDLEKEKLKSNALADRLTIVEDLLLRREDDAEIRASIAELKNQVDADVMQRLNAIADKVGAKI